MLAILGITACSGAPEPVESKPAPVTGTPLITTPPVSKPELPPTPETVRLYSYEVVNAYAHDTGAFTQGLVFDSGFLFEGTGRYGESSLRKVDLKTGKVLQKIELPSQYFGEGIADYGDRIIQLTWQTGVGFVYEKDTFKMISQFYYPGEGWGITYDGSRLIISDGTSTMRFLDPLTFNTVARIQVSDKGTLISGLNELEFVRGQVYANVWQTDKIAIIEPQSGRVTGWLDLTGIIKTRQPSGTAAVLNGIAYDPENDRLFVTGKLWPWLFEIKLIENRSAN